jgi:hypothetical protein
VGVCTYTLSSVCTNLSITSCDLGLDGRIEVVEHLAHAFDGLVQQVLFRELAEGEQVRTPDNPEEKLGVRDPKLPHVLRKRGIEVWKLVVELREDAVPQSRVSAFLRIVFPEAEARGDIAESSKRRSAVEKTFFSFER